MRSLEPGLTIEVSHDFEAALGLEGSRAVVRPEEWDALLQSAPSNVVFMTWQWQRIWWRHFGAEAGCTLHLLAVRREGGALAGIAPLLLLRSRSLRCGSTGAGY